MQYFCVKRNCHQWNWIPRCQNENKALPVSECMDGWIKCPGVGCVVNTAANCESCIGGQVWNDCGSACTENIDFMFAL